MDVAAPPRICAFLRADTNGTLGEPIDWPEPSNRCVALGDAAPKSLRQQEYACLASAHVNCPRFLRGLDTLETQVHATGSTMRLTPAIVAALVVLGASFALSVGFVVVNGGMNIHGPGLAAEAPSPSPSPSPSAAQPSESSAVESEAATPTPAPSAPAPTPSPTTEPTPAAAATRSPTPTATPRPSSDRYELLTSCGDAPDCWIYVVRSGDNLVSIARYFGISLETVRELNPWTETTPLVAGQELRLPPPTR